MGFYAFNRMNFLNKKLWTHFALLGRAVLFALFAQGVFGDERAGTCAAELC